MSLAPASSDKPLVIVSAGVLIENGRVLVTQRKAGAHLGGTWEFPGGKVNAGEDPRDGLSRELREELGLDVMVRDIVDVAFHRYEDAGKTVLLLFFDVARRDGSPPPQAIDVAAFVWADEDALRGLTFPPADESVLAKVTARLARLSAEASVREP